MEFPNEALEEIRLKCQNEKRWASYSDLNDVNDVVLEAALSAAGEFCYDAVNLTFEYSSSTSGMYPSWHVRISPSCTVYMDRMMAGAPTGHGGSLTAALADFALRCRKATVARETTPKVLDKGDRDA